MTGDTPSDMAFDQEKSVVTPWGIAALQALTLVSSRDEDDGLRFYRDAMLYLPKSINGDCQGEIRGFDEVSTSDKSYTSSMTRVTTPAVGEIRAPCTINARPSPPPKKSRLGWRFYAAFGCLCIINLVCALDATSLSVALPVRLKSSLDTLSTKKGC